DGDEGISSSTGSRGVSIKARKATMTRLAEYLSGQAGRPVIDNTGLKGEYDFELQWGNPDKSNPGPSLFTAIQEQLGLKLEGAKGADRNHRDRQSGASFGELISGTHFVRPGMFVPACPSPALTKRGS